MSLFTSRTVVAVSAAVTLMLGSLGTGLPDSHADGGRILRDAGAGAAVGAGVGLITDRSILRTAAGGAAVGAGIGIFRTGVGTKYDNNHRNSGNRDDRRWKHKRNGNPRWGWND